MVKKTRLILMSVFMLVAVIFAAAGFILLPETVVVQLSFSGETGNTMPKLFAIALPFFLTTVFAYLFYKSEENKYLFISAVGVLVGIATFLFNL